VRWLATLLAWNDVTRDTVRVQPDVHYARNGDVAIAYQVVGDGDRDLVFVPDFVSNLVYFWESAYWREFYERLAQSFRLILFDKRGTGLSDRGPFFPALETRMEDMRAVLDSVGSERAIVFGSHEGGGLAALYAATYPERTDALAVFQFGPSGWGLDDPVGQQRELDRLRATWGTQDFSDQLLAQICPTLLRSEADRLWFANCLRVGATPEVAYELNKAFMESDLSDVLPAIRMPALVLYRGAIAEEYGARDTAKLIPNARLVEIAGSDWWGTFLSREIVDELEAFVATLEQKPRPTVCWRPFCSPIWSGLPRRQRRWGIRVGASCWSSTTQGSGGSSHAIAESSWTLPVTGSSRASRARRGRFGAPLRSRNP
jgi:pimeloyl-ACP methyl ester carboxylesterase